MEIYIISLREVGTDHPVRVQFPGAKGFQAIDRRASTIDDVKGVVTDDAMLTLRRGRKWHHELSSLGAVGCYESHRKVLESGDGPVLIFEEDVLIDTSFTAALEDLKWKMDEFDVLVFGPLMASNTKPSKDLKGFCSIEEEFWGTHAILYSKQGRKKVREAIGGPIDIQIDAKLSRLAMFGDLRLFVQCNAIPLATQSMHQSTIQEVEGSCALCNIDPRDLLNSRIPPRAITSVLIFTALISLSVRKTKEVVRVTPWLLAAAAVLVLALCTMYFFNGRARTFHVVVVCTPNYEVIGAYGVNSLMKYCIHHGYQFTLWREKPEDLHVNFSKNEAVLNTLRRTSSDYVVSIDADVAVHNLDYPIHKLLKGDAVMNAPEDFWFGEDTKKNWIINSGFVVWKNCSRAVEINALWLSEARGGCAQNPTAPQQSVFETCVYPKMSPEELQYIDHRLVGLPHSQIISQTKQGRGAWELLGSPNDPIDITSLPMKN
jgi:GR25 family glycosyltransferase involved in LPS biosynthesis